MSRILVVDDESGIRDLCYDAFTKDGHEVTTLARADKLSEMIKTNKPDLILLDQEMPGTTGLSVFKNIKEKHGVRVPVVFFSGRITPEVEKEAYQIGAIEVIDKSIGFEQLRQKIGKILEAKHRLFGEAADKKEKILIVDDEDAVRNLLVSFFQSKGFRIFSAPTGEDALLIVEKERPNVILLDVTLPGMDGLLTLKRIRKIDPEVGVVLATGMLDSNITEEANQLGVYACVTKPFDLKYLELVVLTRLMIASSPSAKTA